MQIQIYLNQNYISQITKLLVLFLKNVPQFKFCIKYALWCKVKICLTLNKIKI